MTKVFEKKYRVPASDVNVMNHVDNQIYLRWMNEMAIGHSTALGWGLQQYGDIGSAFVVKSHFIEYLAPTFENEELLFLTWIEHMDRRTSTRKYLFLKSATNRPFMKGETRWVYVDIEKGRPMDIPVEVKNSFHIADNDFVEQRISQLKANT